MNMKKQFGLAIGIVCLAASMGAQADTSGSGNLRVIGTIKPAACTVGLGASGGTVDYGTINASSIPPSSFLPLQEKTLPLTVNCGTAAAQMALSVTDSQAASTVAGILGTGFPESQNFGLGMVGTNRTGGYSVRLSSLTSAGTALYPLKRTSSAGAWMYSSDGRVDKHPYQHSWSRNTSPTPAMVTSVTGTLVVRAVINRGSALDLSKDIPLNGLATLVVTRI
jgi:type 1 fimbria pilin